MGLKQASISDSMAEQAPNATPTASLTPGNEGDASFIERRLKVVNALLARTGQPALRAEDLITDSACRTIDPDLLGVGDAIVHAGLDILAHYLATADTLLKQILASKTALEQLNTCDLRSSILYSEYDVFVETELFQQAPVATCPDQARLFVAWVRPNLAGSTDKVLNRIVKQLGILTHADVSSLWATLVNQGNLESDDDQDGGDDDDDENDGGHGDHDTMTNDDED